MTEGDGVEVDSEVMAELIQIFVIFVSRVIRKVM
jgi:hypothetical protein